MASVEALVSERSTKNLPAADVGSLSPDWWICYCTMLVMSRVPCHYSPTLVSKHGKGDEAV